MNARKQDAIEKLLERSIEKSVQRSVTTAEDAVLWAQVTLLLCESLSILRDAPCLKDEAEEG